MELLPAMAILPFMLYQLAGFGTLSYIVPKAVNWALNIAFFVLIVGSYAANRQADYGLEKMLVTILVLILGVTVLCSVLKLKSMQQRHDLYRPHKEVKVPAA